MMGQFNSIQCAIGQLHVQSEEASNLLIGSHINVSNNWNQNTHLEGMVVAAHDMGRPTYTISCFDLHRIGATYHLNQK